jgi:hypothetical protein
MASRGRRDASQDNCTIFVSPFRFWVTRTNEEDVAIGQGRCPFVLFVRINVPTLPQNTHTLSRKRPSALNSNEPQNNFGSISFNR